MLRFAICSFLEPVALGAEFPAGELPLHVTLLGEARTESDLGEVEGAVQRALSGFGELYAVAGDDELFGPDGSVEVTVLEDAGSFVRAHAELIVELRGLEVRVDQPQYAGRGYRPHVTVTDEERLDRGEEIEARAVAVLDLAPDGNAGMRRVVAQLPLV